MGGCKGDAGNPMPAGHDLLNAINEGKIRVAPAEENQICTHEWVEDTTEHRYRVSSRGCQLPELFSWATVALSLLKRCASNRARNIP